MTEQKHRPLTQPDRRLPAKAGVRVAEPDLTLTCKWCGAPLTLTDYDSGSGDYCPEGQAVGPKGTSPHRLSAQPQPESGSAGTSGALREALEGLLAAQEQMLGDPDRRFRGPQAKATRKARAALAAEPQP